jgi:uncharacterized coiled-coil protein SlyX
MLRIQSLCHADAPIVRERHLLYACRRLQPSRAWLWRSIGLRWRVSHVNENRLTEVETRYTFLERLVEDLSRVVHEQQRTIDGLSSRLQRLEALLAEAIDQPHERPAQEKPPHY